MKYSRYLLIFLLVFSSCKSNKVLVDNAITKKISSKKIVKNHLSNVFQAETLDSKIKIEYINFRGDRKNRHGFTARLRMKKDSVIWIQGKKSVVSVFKIKITPYSFSFYSLVDKVYYEGDYTILEKILGIKVGFSQLQNLLVGQSIFEMKGKQFYSEIKENSYKLTPKTQEKLFNVFFKINPKSFKLNQMYLEKKEKNQNLRIDYEKYTILEGNILPIKTTINATEGDDKYTQISMDYKSLTINKPVKIYYRIPSGYKQIEL